MSISVKNLQVTIGGITSSGFDISLDGSLWRFDTFTLCQRLLTYNTLSFSLHKDPEETVNEAKFSICGELIGKSISLTLQTENIENLSLKTSHDKTADVEFKGVIFAASGSRRDSVYTIDVEARSWDALLDDNPNCKSFEEKTLNDIIEDVTGDYSEHLDTEIDARFADTIAYCVQYNETNYQFIQRLARRYGEWLYNDGTKMIFGNLKKRDAVRLAYPSKDIPSYNVQLRMQHVDFKHIASSYNAYDSTVKEGLLLQLFEGSRPVTKCTRLHRVISQRPHFKTYIREALPIRTDVKVCLMCRPRHKDVGRKPVCWSIQATPIALS